VTLRARTWRIAALVLAASVLSTPQAARADSLYVNAIDDRPASVSPDRLYDLADSAATRWHFTVPGNTGAPAGVLDGTQTVGFSKSIDPKALGVTSVWTRPRYKVKKSKRCVRRNGRRYCQTTKRYVRTGTQVVEKDVALNPFVNWQQGPAYPAADQYDLESTILHEFGHFSHPLVDNHIYGCEDSPMIASISPGEFWRDADEWLRFGCSASTGPKLKLAAPAGAAPGHDVDVQVHELPPAIDR
jgi:hypothetical protein